MAINKEKRVHPVDAMLDFKPSIKTQKKKPASKLINFRIDAELADDFKIYCKIKYTELTCEIVNFIKTKVENTKPLIEDYKSKSLL